MSENKDLSFVGIRLYTSDLHPFLEGDNHTLLEARRL